MPKTIEDHQFVAIETARPFLFAVEMAKPIALLYLFRMSLAATLREISFFDLIQDTPLVIICVSIITFGIGNFVSYGLTCDRYVIASSLGQIFGRRHKVVVTEIAIADFKPASVTDYGIGNGIIAFRSNDGRSPSPCRWRKGVWWFFLSFPIRFGFYGISTNGPVARHIRGD